MTTGEPPTPAPAAPAALYNLDLVAALVCMKLRKTDPTIGVGLVARYRQAIDQGIELYGPDAPDGPAEGFGNRYLMEVVMDCLGREAHAVYGDPRTSWEEVQAA